MHKMQLGFVFQKEKCIQCSGCEMACKMWRAPEPGVTLRRVLHIWHGSYPEVTCSSLSLSCLHCAEPACAAACPSQAITKDPVNGRVLVDSNKCTGCKACFDACPYGIPQFGVSGLMQKCDMCFSCGNTETKILPPCVKTCPTGALEIAVLTSAQKADMENALLQDYQKTK